MFALQEIVGFSVSLIVTVKLQVAVLPDASVTTNVFVVLPIGNTEPLARPAVWAIDEPAQLSAKGTVNVFTAPHTPASLPDMILAGQVMVGFSSSIIVVE